MTSPPRRRAAPRRRPVPDRRPARRADGLGGEQVEGRRAVLEALVAGTRRVRRVLVADAQDSAALLDRIESAARMRRVPLATVSRARLDKEARTDGHQGVLARCEPVATVDLAAICDPPGGRLAFLVVCDGVQDPRNLGALLRSAECAGATGVVLPAHRSARLTPAVTKTASGAIEHLAFAAVGGIPSALKELERLGVRTVGLAPDAPRSLYDLDVGGGAVALVVGGEERGLARLTRERCAELASIPQHGAVASLNAAVAGAVACFEVARQRAAAGRAT